MATTYTLISSVTVGSGGAANIEFTSIPGTYTDLVLKLSARTPDAVAARRIDLSFNSSTSNFTGRTLEAEPNSVFSYSNIPRMVGYANGTSWTANTFNSTEIYIPNYTSSNNKSWSVDAVTENNATTSILSLHAGLWSNSAAITAIKLTLTSGNFAQYSTAYLYGISNA